MANGDRASGLITEIKSLCKSAVLEDDSRLTLEVDKDRAIDVGCRLKDAGFDHVKGVTGVDYPNKGLIEVIYYIGTYSKKNYADLVIELKISLSKENPKTPSLIDVWQSCEYPERETYEMFGIIFQGHPKLKLLLLPDDFEGKYPLCKEFKIPEEGIEI